MTRKRQLNNRVFEEVVENPEERMDLHDGDPYREHGSLPPERSEASSLEGHRLRDIQSCSHQIRVNWASISDMQRSDKRNSDDDPQKDDTDDEDLDEDGDIEVICMCVTSRMHVCANITSCMYIGWCIHAERI